MMMRYDGGIVQLSGRRERKRDERDRDADDAIKHDIDDAIKHDRFFL